MFALRQQIFALLPMSNLDGTLDQNAIKKFESDCNDVCASLIFFLCLLNPAIPEESGVIHVVSMGDVTDLHMYFVF